jgi:hypothetical protein
VDVAVSGHYAYVAAANSGLQVIDINDPVNPQRVGALATNAFVLGVALSGQYAYLAGYGLQVIDVSDPTNPTWVATYGAGTRTEDLAISGNYAYVAPEYGGLWIIDISDPANPSAVGGYHTTGLSKRVALSGGYAFLTGTGAGLEIIDISDPTYPRRAGAVAGGASGLAVSGRYACVADPDAGLRVLNILNRANPQVVRRLSGEAGDVAISGHYAYIACGKGFRVFDLASPQNAQPIGIWSAGEDADGRTLAIAVSASYAYLAFGEDGFLVIDVSDPARPRLAGACSYSTQQDVQSVTLAGNYAYVTDSEGGSLHVIDVTDPTNPKPVTAIKGRGNAQCVAMSGPYAYLADDLEGLILLDASDPANLRRIGVYGLNGGAYFVGVSGQHAYVGDSAGLHVLDLSDPANPRELGGCDCGVADVALNGDYAYVSDAPGLLVLDVSDPAKPRRVGGNTAFAARAVVASSNQVFVAASSDGLIVLNPFTPLPTPFVERQSLGFRVRLEAWPPLWATNYIVQEHPPFPNPANISQGGSFDSKSGIITFGPFNDNLARTLTYEDPPPLGSYGRFVFSGEAAANGTSAAIVGDGYLEIPPFPALDVRLLLRWRPLSQQVAIQLIGGSGAPCFILASTNLQDWAYLGDLGNVFQGFELVDAEAPNHPYRFYRAQTIPPPAPPLGSREYQGVNAQGQLDPHSFPWRNPPTGRSLPKLQQLYE